MSKLFRIIKQGNVDISEGRTEQIQLPRTVIDTVFIKARFPVKNGSSAIDVKSVPAMLKELFKEIAVEVDGTDLRVSADFLALRRLETFEHSRSSTLRFNLDANAEDTWEAFIRIPFSDINAINPVETALDGRKASVINLRFTTGDLSGYGATIQQGGLASVHVREILNVDEGNFLTRRLSELSVDMITGENTINLPYGKYAYKKLILIGWARNSTTGKWEKSTDFIQTIRVRKRANTIHYVERDVLEQINYIEKLENTGLASIDIDFEHYGKHARAVRTDDTTEFVLELETTTLDGYDKFKVDILSDTIELPEGVGA